MEKYKLRESVNAAATLMVVGMIVITVAYYIRIRVKSVKKTELLKPLRGEALLTESV